MGNNMAICQVYFNFNTKQHKKNKKIKSFGGDVGKNQDVIWVRVLVRLKKRIFFLYFF